MICTFFGHRDTPPEIQASLREVILHLIETQGVHQFFVGNQGSFDAMACSLLSGFEQTHGIKYETVLAYFPKKESIPSAADHIILPEGIETVPPRFAIEYRNKWMIDRSDIVITYVCRSFGGAAKFKSLAIRKKKNCYRIGKERSDDRR